MLYAREKRQHGEIKSDEVNVRRTENENISECVQYGISLKIITGKIYTKPFYFLPKFFLYIKFLFSYSFKLYVFFSSKKLYNIFLYIFKLIFYFFVDFLI